MATHSNILAWRIPGQSSLAGYIHGVTEADTTEGIWHALNGTPLQYSCLENPMDGGAW